MLRPRRLEWVVEWTSKKILKSKERINSRRSSERFLIFYLKKYIFAIFLDSCRSICLSFKGKKFKSFFQVLPWRLEYRERRLFIFKTRNVFIMIVLIKCCTHLCSHYDVHKQTDLHCFQIKLAHANRFRLTQVSWEASKLSDKTFSQKEVIQALYSTFFQFS